MVVERHEVPVAAKEVEGGVVDDPVQPGLDVDRALVVHERCVRARQTLLHGVLGALDADEAARVAHQRRPVAVHELRERRVAPGAHEAHEALVALQAQDRPSCAPEGL